MHTLMCTHTQVMIGDVVCMGFTNGIMHMRGLTMGFLKDGVGTC